MIVTNYKIKDIQDFEDFLNNLYIGLEYYKKHHPDFKYKLSYSENNIELKTIKLNESSN